MLKDELEKFDVPYKTKFYADKASIQNYVISEEYKSDVCLGISVENNGK